MGNIKQNLLIDKLLFIFHSLFLSFFLYQLYIDNFRYYAFNNISFLKVIVLSPAASIVWVATHPAESFVIVGIYRTSFM